MTPTDDPRDVAAERGRGVARWTWFDPGEPHLVRGPFARWPRATDGALVVVVVVATMIAVAVSQLADGESFTVSAIVDRPAGAVALVVLGAGSLWWRRARPIAVAAFVIAAMLAWAVAGYGDGNDLALVVAVYSVGRYGIDHRLGLATLVAAAGGSIAGSVIDASQRIDVLPALVVVGLPWYVGRRVRNRGDYLVLLRERAERLEAEQHARARRAVAEERSRIARELHDVVAHQVSMMTVQAGAAKTVARDDVDSAIEAMGDVERAGRQALGELRHLLGVLRRDTADSDQLGPQPGLADLAALADELTHTGAAVTLAVADLPDHLSTAVDLSAYRIVQESVTNVVKHAGACPVVDISVGLDGGTLVLDVTNTITTPDGARSGLPASGYGIAGMRERATLLGGTVSAGPYPPDRYRVTARLPLEPEPT